MALKYQQEVQGYPLAPATIMPRSDQESATNYLLQEHARKKRRTKCLACIGLLAVLVTVIVLALVFIVLRAQTPRVRLEGVTVTNGVNGNVRFSARVVVRNRNFGRYRLHSSLATIRSGDRTVGEFVIPDARTRSRSSRRLYVITNLNALSTNSGVISVNVNARLRGELEFARFIERKRSANLSCTMTINLANNAVRDLRCV